MAENQTLFRCPICYRGNVLEEKSGEGVCSNCRNVFEYNRKSGTYVPGKYNKRYGNEDILGNWRKIYREYKPKKGLTAEEWNELAEKKGGEYQARKEIEDERHEGIRTDENPGWAGAVLWPILLPIAGFIIGIVRMARGGVRRKSGILCFSLSVVFLVVYPLLVFGLSGSGSAGGTSVSPYISMVKEGALESYPDRTIGSAVKGFIRNPKWETGVTEDGERVVNVRGEVLYDEEPTEIAIQFLINEGDTFEITAMEAGGEPLTLFEMAGFIEAMYDD